MGTHEYTDDPRNANVWVSINGELFRRPEAKVSVLDAGFLLGDGVWEAFRLHGGVLEEVQPIYTALAADRIR
jgi:branched-chain amino acid aminotransferase